jgi:hypothetical protein
MSSSFQNADKRTHRKVMLVGLLFCAGFVAISLFAREQPDNGYVLRVRNAGSPLPASRPKEKSFEGGSSTQNLLQQLAHGEEAMARRTGQR